MEKKIVFISIAEIMVILGIGVWQFVSIRNKVTQY